MGRTFRKQNSSSEQIFKVDKYWTHEKFDNETFDNDIGELTLPETIINHIFVRVFHFFLHMILEIINMFPMKIE